MSSRLTIRIALAAAFAVAALPAAAAEPGTQSAAPASVRITDCQRGQSPADRQVEFRGAMKPVRGTSRMWMRFRLQERAPGERFVTVRAPGLGVWRKSRRGVGRFAYRQRVVDLVRGSRYRAIVYYRWYSASGKRLRSTRRVSGVCRQGSLPNLQVVGITGTQVGPGTVRYTVRVANTGRVPASDVEVSLSVDGATIDTPVVDRLGPGEVRRVNVNGPRCDNSVEAVVDPSGSVRESSETDNVRTEACPAL